jgi:hypothetical protein
MEELRRLIAYRDAEVAADAERGAVAKATTVPADGAAAEASPSSSSSSSSASAAVSSSSAAAVSSSSSSSSAGANNPRFVRPFFFFFFLLFLHPYYSTPADHSCFPNHALMCALPYECVRLDLHFLFVFFFFIFLCDPSGAALAAHQPFLAVSLSSRRNMCVHPSVSGEPSRAAVDTKCRALTAPWVRERAIEDPRVPICEYYEGFEALSEVRGAVY